MEGRGTALRAGTAVLCTGLTDASLRGARAWVVPTESQPSPSWSSERVSLRLADPPPERQTHPFVAVRASALVACCAGCWAAEAKGTQLKTCAQCHGPRYCGAVCQTADWKARHKQECKTLRQVRETESVPASAAAPATPAGMRPWPITLETPGMLRGIFPCYLTAHPEQWFLPGAATQPKPPAGRRLR